MNKNIEIIRIEIKKPAFHIEGEPRNLILLEAEICISGNNHIIFQPITQAELEDPQIYRSIIEKSAENLFPKAAE